MDQARDGAEKNERKPPRKRTMGVVGLLVVLGQYLVTHETNRSTSSEITAQLTELTAAAKRSSNQLAKLDKKIEVQAMTLRLERERDYVKKDEVRVLTAKIDRANGALSRIEGFLRWRGPDAFRPSFIPAGPTAEVSSR